MANELQPLSLLFQNRLFRIPDYQRGYAWLQQQLVDFANAYFRDNYAVIYKHSGERCKLEKND